jgi:hypothetical protein
MEQKHGIEWVNEQKAIKLKAFGVFASYAETNLASSPAVPAHRVANPDATQDEPSKTIYTVSDFSFTYSGSVYSVTHAKNGLLIGTKDGQGWGSWQVTPSRLRRLEAMRAPRSRLIR